jgi:hypothetical protein
VKHCIMLLVILLYSCSNITVVSKKHNSLDSPIKKVLILFIHQEDQTKFINDLFFELPERLKRKDLTCTANVSKKDEQKVDMFSLNRDGYDIILKVEFSKLIESIISGSFDYSTNTRTGPMRNFGKFKLRTTVWDAKNPNKKYWEASFKSEDLGGNGINGSIFSSLIIEQLEKDGIIQ